MGRRRGRSLSGSPDEKMLTYEVVSRGELRTGAPLFVFLHGRGADRFDLQGLLPFLPEGSALVTPQGPHPSEPWGYGPGWAWYRHLRDDVPEAAGFEESLEAMGAFLAGVPDDLAGRGLLDGSADPGPLVLGGFSQGGTMSLALALGAAEGMQVPYAVDLSGFLPDHPHVRVTPQTARGTAFFWGHGTEDEAVSFRWAEAGWERLREAGADLTAHAYPGGHMIGRQEIRDLQDWLEAKGLC